MSYSGSTATTPNPPRLLVPAMSGPGRADSTSVNVRASQLWIYNSSDSVANIQTAAYFTDGKQLGMKIGDMMMALMWSTESATGHITMLGALVTTNSTAGWNLSTGGSMTSTFG